MERALIDTDIWAESSAGIGVSECAPLRACGGGGLSVACGELAGGGIEAVVTIDHTRGNQAGLSLIEVGIGSYASFPISTTCPS